MACPKDDYAMDIIDHGFLRDFCLVDPVPDVICLQEVPKAAWATIEYWQREINATTRRWPLCLFEEGSRVGFLIFNTNLHVIEDHTLESDIRTCYLLLGLGPDTPLMGLVNCYASAYSQERLHYFENAFPEVLDLASSSCNSAEIPLLVVGDLNDFPSETDSLNPSYRGARHWNRTVQPLLEELDLLDAFRKLYPDKIQYSCCRPRDFSLPALSATRIDHAICNEKAAEYISEVSYVDVTQYARFDHHMLSVDLNIAINVAKKSGRHFWKLHPSLLLSSSFAQRLDGFLKLLIEKVSKQTPLNQVKNIIWSCRQFTMLDSRESRDGYVNKEFQKKAPRLLQEYYLGLSGDQSDPTGSSLEACAKA